MIKQFQLLPNEIDFDCKVLPSGEKE